MKKLILAMTLVFAWSALSQGDVVIKQKTTADMAGLMTMESNVTNVIKGDKNYIDMTSEMTGGMMAKLGGGKPRQNINITRLDKGLYYELDPEKKVYTETPISSLKEQYAKSEKDAVEDSAKSEYIWTVDVKTTGQNQKINGFDCTNMVGKAIGVKRDNPKDSVSITFDEWMAKNVPGQAEVEQYQKSYANALGIDQMWGQKNLGQSMKDYGPELQKLALEMQKSGGYPIKSIISIEGGAKSGDGGSSGNEPAMKPEIMAKMGGLFGKKKADASQGQDVSQGGKEKTLYMTTEVLSVEQKPTDDAQFDVPAGYKKK